MFDIKNSHNEVFKTILSILQKPTYFILSIFVAFTLAIASFALAIRSIVALSFQLPAGSVFDRILLVFDSFRAVPLNLSSSSIVFILIVAVLTGINIALLVYYFRRRTQFFRGSSIGFVGIISGILGVGCGACGSVILSSIIGLSASWTLIGVLPLHGAEFSMLAVVLLAYSILSLSRKLSPERIITCDV